MPCVVDDASVFEEKKVPLALEATVIMDIVKRRYAWHASLRIGVVRKRMELQPLLRLGLSRLLVFLSSARLAE